MSESATQGVIAALFTDRGSAERAFRCVEELGYDPSDINVIMSKETREREFGGAPQTDLGKKAMDSADGDSKAAKELGGPTGGTLGTAAPVIAAIGAAVLVPGIGLLAAGPIAVALTAATAVGVAGGLVAALTNWGVPRSRLEEYEGAIRKGAILLGVQPRSSDDIAQLTRCWQNNGGRLIHS